jgi:hypothetical protein
MRYYGKHRGLTRPLLVVLLATGVVLLVAQFNQAQTDPDTGPVTGRQPTIADQFNSVSSGALQARAPGTQIQQAVGVINGGDNPIVGDAVPAPPSFLADTVEMILLEIIDQISQILSGLNLLAGGNPLSGLLGGNGGTGGLGNLFGNALTGGTGSIPIQ